MFYQHFSCKIAQLHTETENKKGALQALTTDMGKPIEQAAYWLHLTIFTECFSWDLTLFLLLFEKNEEGIKGNSVNFRS